jgi:hypothetical protein
MRSRSPVVGRRLEIEVAVAPAMLCRAESEFFGWITRERATIGVLAARSGWTGSDWTPPPRSTPPPSTPRR